MLEKMKRKFKKQVTTEIVKEGAKGFKRWVPKVIGIVMAVAVVLTCGFKHQTHIPSGQTVNNYYIYNGPVYSHE